MDQGLVLDSVSRQAQLKEITDRLEAGIEEIFTVTKKPQTKRPKPKKEPKPLGMRL